MPYGTDASVERLLDGIPDRKNRETVRTYLEENRANGVRISSLLSQGNHLRHWAVFLGDRPFTAATKEDVRRFTNLRTTERTWRPGGTTKVIVRRVPIGNTTLNIRKVTLKAFQRWARGGDKRGPYPEEVAWLTQKRSASDEALPVEQILTPDELRLMVEAAPDTQTKALLAALYDSGARASEFCSLRIGNVVFDDYGAILALPKDASDLKTGARRIRVITSTPYLRAWINAHPHAKKPTAPLWLAMANRNGTADRLRAHSLGYVVDRAAKRAGLAKEVYPHLFRHSRATLAAKEGWPESVMRAHFGWSRSSDMPSRYIHLAGKDADDFILAAAGVKAKNKAETLEKIAPKACPAGHLNAATNQVCDHPGCGRPVTPEAAERRQSAEMEVLLGMLTSNRELMETIGKAAFKQTVARAKAKRRA